MSGYATGRYAVGFCKKCGLNFAYGDLVDDGETPGLRVCQECYDPKHPQERPARAYDPIALRKPAPESIPNPTVDIQYPIYIVEIGEYFGPPTFATYYSGPPSIAFDAPDISIQFESATYSGAYGSPVTVYATRTGGSVGSVSAEYDTQDGTAIAGVDYVAASGTLTWGNGDVADKSVVITTNVPPSMGDNFDSYPVGDAPAAWPLGWGYTSAPPAGFEVADWNIVVAANPNIGVGNVLRTEQAVDPSKVFESTRNFGTSTVTDFDITSEISLASVSIAHTTGGVVARASGSEGNRNGYTASIGDGPTSEGIKIFLHQAGVSTVIGSASKAVNLSTRYKIRFQGIGSSLKAKFWVHNVSEPVAWDIETTNSAITTAGTIGVYSNRSAYFDSFDYIDYGARDFSVVLSNPVNAQLGSPDTTVVTLE